MEERLTELKRRLAKDPMDPVAMRLLRIEAAAQGLESVCQAFGGHNIQRFKVLDNSNPPTEMLCSRCRLPELRCCEGCWRPAEHCFRWLDKAEPELPELIQVRSCAGCLDQLAPQCDLCDEPAVWAGKLAEFYGDHPINEVNQDWRTATQIHDHIPLCKAHRDHYAEAPCFMCDDVGQLTSSTLQAGRGPVCLGCAEELDNSFMNAMNEMRQAAESIDPIEEAFHEG